MDPQESAPAPAEPEQYDSHTKVGNALTVTQPGERQICEIKRHPIGIIGIYAATGVLLVVAAVLAFVVAPNLFHSADGSSSATTEVGAALFILVALVSLAFTFISTKVYWGNSWVLTTDSVTQITQVSLFHRESSQLSLGNLEDVTAEQNGILTHLFNYGLLRVETAGERSKFVFTYCPNPNYYAQQVLAARENFEQNRRANEDYQRNYRGEGSYPQPPAAQPGPGPGPAQPTDSTSPAPQMQAGDPGYGAFQPMPEPPAEEPPQPPPTSQIDYPSDSSDQGVNVNA
ncbi:MAG TPA: hypothetical protein VLG27_01260 [Candidatus Saccharimonadia bacterium]|nr:hypothetical protein [Candidatus Saccharimonadia bacterium]